MFKKRTGENDDSENEQKALLNLFYTLQEYFDVYASKHNKTRLKMEIVKQNEDNEDE